MYKILVVDDEVLVRIGFKTYIPWEEYGFTIAGEAENGREALEKCSRLHPDVVFTDIKMPYIDGIQLLEILRENYPYIKSVVLSCYDDFNLVKQSMKLGARDYILKPTMEQNDIINILNNLKNELDEQRINKTPIRPAKTQIAVQSVRPVEEMLQDLIIRNDTIVYDAVCGSFDGFDINTAHNCICLFHIDNYNTLLKQKTYDQEQFRKSIKSVADNTIKSNGCLFNSFHPYEYGLFFIYSGSNAREIEKSILLTLEKLQNNIRNYMNCNVTFGVSNIERNKNDLNKLFKQAEEILQLKFYNNPGSILPYSGIIHPKSSSNKISISFDNDLITKYIADSDKKSLFEYMDDNFSKIFGNKSQDIDTVRKNCIQLLFLFELRFSSYIEIKELFETSDYYEYIRNEDFLVSIKDFTYHLIEKLINIYDLGQKNFDNIIKKAVEYMEKHYMENLTLTIISNHVGLSKSYFCNLFKQQTKKNFVDFLYEIRMKKAKKLFADPQLKIYEVSKAVGIDNTRHFCNIFKRYYGVTPLEFKKHYPEN